VPVLSAEVAAPSAVFVSVAGADIARYATAALEYAGVGTIKCGFLTSTVCPKIGVHVDLGCSGICTVAKNMLNCYGCSALHPIIS